MLATKVNPRPLSKVTINKRCAFAKQFFEFAVKDRIILENPFEAVESANLANQKREYFVSREESELVSKACPDAEWRLIFALCRYGGLRCPSELRLLKWGDIDWERRRILITSPKTAHQGKEERWIPSFPELLPYLEECFDLAEPGTVYVLTNYRNNANLRTRFEKIIHRAGLEPWPKLFQNLRSTRQTELEETFPSHVVCA